MTQRQSAPVLTCGNMAKFKVKSGGRGVLLQDIQDWSLKT
jgi:hypothetical protein